VQDKAAVLIFQTTLFLIPGTNIVRPLYRPLPNSCEPLPQLKTTDNSSSSDSRLRLKGQIASVCRLKNLIDNNSGFSTMSWLYGILSIQQNISERKNQSKEVKNPKAITQKGFDEKGANLLTDLASSKRTATSKAVNPQKQPCPHAQGSGSQKAGVRESQTQLRGKKHLKQKTPKGGLKCKS